MLINIVLSTDSNVYKDFDSTYMISFFINLSGVLIGAFLAYLISLCIDKKQRRKEKEKDFAKTIELNNVRLRHLATLIDNAIIIAKKQAKQYAHLAGKIDKDPYEKHLVNITLTNDFERIKRLDSQKIFEAYTNAIKSNNDRIENYSKLFHQIDFLDLKLKQMYDMQAMHINYTFNDECYIRDIIEDLVYLLTISVVELSESFPTEYRTNKFYLFASDLLHKSSTNSESGLAYFKNEFIIPLRDNSQTKFNFDKLLANQILEKTKRILARLNNIEINSKEHSKTCNTFKREIGPALKVLIELNNEIKINLP